jgi:hypothetical protein
MSTLEDIARGAVLVLAGNTREGIEARGKNASGSTSRSIAVLSSSGLDSATASLEANSNWKYVGNGRGPGRQPPITPIRSWIASRGLDLSEWAVAKKIARLGSFDYRMRRRNIFLEEIEAWERDYLPTLDTPVALYLDAKVGEIIDNNALNTR